MKRVTDRRGYITLEASIVLPVFILAILALGFYIRVFAIMENVTYCMLDEVSLISSRAYAVKSVPLFEEKLKKRISADEDGINDLKISRMRYLYSDMNKDDLIFVKADYTAEVSLPVDMDHVFDLSSQVKCRGFTGKYDIGIPMSFEEMETDGVWDPVWVFPLDGEKYHKETCTYVVANAKKSVLTNKLKKQYGPCELCKAENASMGSYIYYFAENGVVYHTEDCRQVKRYTIEINRDEAIGKGYIPCSKCGGG